MSLSRFDELEAEWSDIRKVVAADFHGDVGAYADACDVAPSVALWPKGMRKLLYEPKRYVGRFTLMWFLLSNGVYPPDAVRLTLAGQPFLDRSTVGHLDALVQLYAVNPGRYKSPMLTAYKEPAQP